MHAICVLKVNTNMFRIKLKCGIRYFFRNITKPWKPFRKLLKTIHNIINVAASLCSAPLFWGVAPHSTLKFICLLDSHMTRSFTLAVSSFDVVSKGQHFKKKSDKLRSLSVKGGRARPCPKFYLKYHMTTNLYTSLVNMIGRSTYVNKIIKTKNYQQVLIWILRRT